MADIGNNLFYHILFNGRIPVDRKVETLVEAFNAAAGDPAQAREEYSNLVSHLLERNQELIKNATTKGPGAGEPQAEIARMHYILGASQAQEFLFDMLDKACKQAGAACLETRQMEQTAQTLANLKARNAGLRELANNPDGLKEFLEIEAARESVVADAPVTVRKSPIRFKK
ncbi:MAG: hypothetical protein EPN97_07915 [Alphaproteobacteria bacterium]|nr:MAG: hypothetical protein EPN97_07915 [Alphaproteobacteria bacterium]